MTRRNPYTVIGTHCEYEVNSASDLMKQAGLDWKVTLENVFINATDPLEVPDRYATVKWTNAGSLGIGLAGCIKILSISFTPNASYIFL